MEFSLLGGRRSYTDSEIGDDFMKRKVGEISQGIRNLWKRTDAQDLVEYALLLIMVALAVAATTRTFGRSVKNTYAGALVGLNGIVGASINGTGVNVAAGSGAGAFSAAAAANAALGTTFNSNAQAANNAGTFAAAFDFAAAAASINAAAFADNAAAGLAGTGTGFATALTGGLTTLANNAVSAAATFVAQAAAALSGTTTTGI
jgi:Flp pilus assembly pilin Flp